MLKILGGEFRSRQLAPPPDDRTSRPYTNRVKESVFNLLRGWFEGASVLDLFAGVGTMGLEAISRGATHAVMIERDRRTHQRLRENIERLGCADRAIAVHGDAFGQAALHRARAPVDVVFIDPPYLVMAESSSRQRVFDLAGSCRAIMGDRRWLVLRIPPTSNGMDYPIPGFDGPEVHEYSHEMSVLLYTARPAGREAE